jgi:hypothetical protein
MLIELCAMMKKKPIKNFLWIDLVVVMCMCKNELNLAIEFQKKLKTK